MATAKDTNLLLDCFICGRRREQNNPRQLACKHSFCLSCLIETPSLVKEVSLQCPVCWQNTTLNNQGLQGLPPDDQVIGVANAIKVQKSVSVCFMCTQKAIVKEARVRCNNCQLRFCTDCAKQHRESEIFSGHLIEENVCEIHIRELTHGCLTCSIELCFECVVSPFHKDHLVCDIVDVKEKATTLMAQGKRLLEEELQNVDQTMNKVVDKSLKFLKERRKETEEKLERYKAELFQAIKESMDERAEKFHKSVLKSLEKQQEACSNATNCVNDLTFSDEGKYQMLHTLTRKRFDLFQALKSLRCSDFVSATLPELKDDVCVTEKDAGNRHYEFKCTIGGIVSDPEAINASAENEGPSRLRCMAIPDFSQKPVKYITLNKLPNTDNFNQLYYVTALPDRKALIGCYGWTSAFLVNANGALITEYSSPDLRCIRGIAVSNGTAYIGDNTGTVISFDNHGKNSCTKLSNISKWEVFDLEVHEDDLLVVKCRKSVDKYSVTGQWRETIKTGGFLFVNAAEHPAAGKVYLASEYNEKRLHIYSIHGKCIRQIGEEGTGDGQFQYVGGSCMLPNGNILIPDASMHRISEFTFEGQFVRHVLNQNDGLNTPYNVSFYDNCLWVACNTTLFMFEYIG